MFETAIKARLPFIGVSTDDLVNIPVILQSIAEMEIVELPDKPVQNFVTGKLYWTTDESHATPERYRKLHSLGVSVVFVNCPPNSLIFDSGILPTPPDMIAYALKDHLLEADIGPVTKALVGLSPKSAIETVQLAQAQSGYLSPESIRKVRSALSGAQQGLYPVETNYEFYEPAPVLEQWLEVNGPYFIAGDSKLRPRGMLLTGAPGTGKTMAAKLIAREFDVPLYRLDVSTALDRYIGVSENRVAKILTLVDREAPCVLLIDEVEKIFIQSTSDSGVTQRILSQLLWWLAEHQSKVFTVMTTNDYSKLPGELYRPGRMDKVIYLPPFAQGAAAEFLERAFQYLLDRVPSEDEKKALLSIVEETTRVPSNLIQALKDSIKKFGWN